MQGQGSSEKKSHLMKLIEIVSNLRKKEIEKDDQMMDLNNSLTLISSRLNTVDTRVDELKKSLTLKPYRKTYDLLEKARKDLKDTELNLVSRQLLQATEENLVDKIDHDVKTNRLEIDNKIKIINSKHDNFKTLIDKEMERINFNLKSLDENVTAQFENSLLHINKVELKVSSIDTRLVKVEKQIAFVEIRMSSLEIRMSSLEKRFESLEEKFENNAASSRKFNEYHFERIYSSIETLIKSVKSLESKYLKIDK